MFGLGWFRSGSLWLILLKKSDRGSGRQLSRNSRKTASSNISDLAWKPTPKFRSASSDFAAARLFQQYRWKADISLCRRLWSAPAAVIRYRPAEAGEQKPPRDQRLANRNSMRLLKRLPLRRIIPAREGQWPTYF